jgi:hypothetical protein
LIWICEDEGAGINSLSQTCANLIQHSISAEGYLHHRAITVESADVHP